MKSAISTTLLSLALIAAGCDSTGQSSQSLLDNPPEVTAPKVESKSKCDPNYSGCVPIASDVDCAGGSGNGPAYVRGPIKVIGSDIYGLDGRDGDGIACE